MHLEYVKYDLSHGFPTHWPTGQFEHKIISEHLQKNSYDLVVNQTWGFLECENPVTKEKSDKFKIFEYLVTNKLANDVLFFNFVDPIYDLSTWYDVFERCRQANDNFKITCMGHMDSDKIELQYPFGWWAVFVNDNFKTYTETETAPVSFDNLFLCYNRKPHSHRRLLYREMARHRVIEKGIFTLGNEDQEKIRLVNADITTMPADNQEMHGELGIPNDTMTLGNLEAWNSHLVTIVTETQHVLKIGYPWFSEKIWKPIIGMRPFLLLGDGGSLKYLEENGFHTFNEVFGMPNKDATVNDIVFAIKRFNKDPAEVYNSLLSQLRHNKKRFFEYAVEQKKIFHL